MAWIEQRRRRYCVITRIDETKVKGPTYADRADVELFVRLADEYGWQEAIAYVATVEPEPQTPARPASVRERAVAAGATDDAQALPFTDPLLPAPPGREPSGVSVGELVRLHIDSASARPKTIDQYRSYVRDHIDPFFGDLDASCVIRRPHPQAEDTIAGVTGRHLTRGRQVQHETGVNRNMKVIHQRGHVVGNEMHARVVSDPQLAISISPKHTRREAPKPASRVSLHGGQTVHLEGHHKRTDVGNAAGRRRDPLLACSVSRCVTVRSMGHFYFRCTFAR